MHATEQILITGYWKPFDDPRPTSWHWRHLQCQVVRFVSAELNDVIRYEYLVFDQNLERLQLLCGQPCDTDHIGNNADRDYVLRLNVKAHNRFSMEACYPLDESKWHWLVKIGEYESAQLLIEHFQAKATVQVLLRAALKLASPFRSVDETVAFIRWLVIRKRVPYLDAKQVEFKLDACTTRIVDETFDSRKELDAMHALVLVEKRRSGPKKLDAPVNHSFFGHTLFDRNVVGMIAGYLYESYEIPQ